MNNRAAILLGTVIAVASTAWNVPQAANREPLGLQTTSSPSASAAVSSPDSSAVVKRSCVTCHNTRTKTAGLMLDTLDVTQPGDHPEVWEKVLYASCGQARCRPPGCPDPTPRRSKS